VESACIGLGVRNIFYSTHENYGIGNGKTRETGQDWVKKSSITKHSRWGKHYDEGGGIMMERGGIKRVLLLSNIETA